MIEDTTSRQALKIKNYKWESDKFSKRPRSWTLFGIIPHVYKDIISWDMIEGLSDELYKHDKALQCFGIKIEEMSIRLQI